MPPGLPRRAPRSDRPLALRLPRVGPEASPGARPRRGSGPDGDPPCAWPAVIKEFCKNVGASTKTQQGLIRLAKTNGGKLGFLA